MTVIGTVGLPGSGKGVAAAVAREEGVPVVTMGDVIREACRERGLDPETHHGQVATALREEDGPAAIAERSLPLVREELASAGTVLVDGLRSPVEVETFETLDERFLVVSIEAPFEVRAERLGERDRDETDTDREALREREERERGFGMDEVMAEADVVVRNTDSVEAFRDRVRTLLREGPAALADDEAVELRTDRATAPSGADSGVSRRP